jgi:hypothetical protein
VESTPTVLAVPLGGPGRSWGLRLVRRRPLEGKRRGVLMEPGG